MKRLAKIATLLLLLVGISISEPPKAAAQVCPVGRSISIEQFDAARSGGCHLGGKLVSFASPAGLLSLEVPGRNESQVVVVDGLDPHEYAIYTDKAGNTVLQLDNRSIGGPSRASGGGVGGPVPMGGPLTGCGQSSSWTRIAAQNPPVGRIFGKMPYYGYKWRYNYANQPSVAALDLIKNAFSHAVADSSSCGTRPTSARWSFLGYTGRNGSAHDGYSSIAWDRGMNSTVWGVAGYWTSAGVIVEADIRFNARAPFHFSSALPVPRNRVDFGSVASHEVLHNYGLGHVADGNQVMFPFINAGPGTDRRTKRSGDLQGMATLYP